MHNDSNAFTLSPTHGHHLRFRSGNCSTAVMALQQRMGCELDFGSHLLEGRQHSSVPKFSTGLHGTQAGNICSLRVHSK